MIVGALEGIAGTCAGDDSPPGPDSLHLDLCMCCDYWAKSTWPVVALLLQH